MATKKKDTKASSDLTGKGTHGKTISLTDIYEELRELKSDMAATMELVKTINADSETPKKSGKRKKTKEEKAAIKKALVDAGPYTKTSVLDLKGTEVRMLGSALGYNTFGIAPDVIRKEVLKHYAKKKPAGKKR